MTLLSQLIQENPAPRPQLPSTAVFVPAEGPSPVVWPHAASAVRDAFGNVVAAGLEVDPRHPPFGCAAKAEATWLSTLRSHSSPYGSWVPPMRKDRSSSPGRSRCWAIPRASSTPRTPRGTHGQTPQGVTPPKAKASKRTGSVPVPGTRQESAPASSLKEKAGALAAEDLSQLGALHPFLPINSRSVDAKLPGAQFTTPNAEAMKTTRSALSRYDELLASVGARPADPRREPFQKAGRPPSLSRYDELLESLGSKLPFERSIPPENNMDSTRPAERHGKIDREFAFRAPWAAMDLMALDSASENKLFCPRSSHYTQDKENWDHRIWCERCKAWI